MSSMTDDFAVFILTNGRPDTVLTYDLLKKSGYDGKVFIVIDNMDKMADQYKKKFGNIVYVFDKKKAEKEMDQGDNLEDMRAIVYARNASFEIAKELGIKYFIHLDDDYTKFYFKFNSNGRFGNYYCKNINKVFQLMLDFYKNTNIYSIAFAQGGDFIGGAGAKLGKKITLSRKCMNSFLLSTDRPFKFLGKMNEDVSTYTLLGSQGKLFFTMNHFYLIPKATQSLEGGMSEAYKEGGTYIKSFYSVMYHPSSIKVKYLRTTHKRLHHSINWECTVPKIVSERYKK